MEHYAAFWNVENLFDVKDSLRRSEKLARTLANELDGWSTSVLERKVEQLASIIARMNDGRGPDLLGVCEVENAHVLIQLVEALGSLGRRYAMAHADTADRRGIDVAFIYDPERFTAEEQFSHYLMKRQATRDLFQVNFRTAAGYLLVVIGNHWPSRRGGQLASEPYRILAGETLAYFHERIQQIHGGDVAVLAMGDFNDEPFDRSLRDYALSERLRGKVTRARTPRFLNLMWEEVGAGRASYFYSGTPHVLDQILASRGLLTGSSGLEVAAQSAAILDFDEMVASGVYRAPRRYGRKDDVDPHGYSDHFPVAVRVNEAP